MEEEWKVVEGFDLYEISNMGRLKSKPRLRKNGVGIYLTRERIMNPSLIKGYPSVVLKQDGKSKRFYVHQLVAMAFIPNPSEKPFINHIDNNPQNNNISNLEWCTPKENSEWMSKQGRNKRTESWLDKLHKSQEKTYKGVKGTSIKTGEVLVFDNLNEVRKKGFQPSCVCNCCKGIRKTHAGYTWEYI